MATLKEDFIIQAPKQEEIKIVDINNDFKDITHDCYGSDFYELTQEQLESLKNGKVLLLKENGGEYQMFLKLK